MKERMKFNAVIIFGGLVFGFGLGFSEMAKPEIVLNFLQLQDFGLLFVMLGAALIAGIVFEFGTRLEKTAPLTSKKFGKRHKELDNRVVLGAVIFGLGWGISGICPGAAYASLGIGNYPVLAGIAGMLLGAYIQGLIRSKKLINTTGEN
jgi:uncharacterized membrane protein YedE/YeeE